MYIHFMKKKSLLLQFINEVQKLLEQNGGRQSKQRVALKNEMWSVKPVSDGQVILL